MGNNYCCPQPAWTQINCDALTFTSIDETVVITKTDSCTFDFSVVETPIEPLLITNTNSIDLSGDGSAIPLSANVNISESAGNIISILPDGLYATASAPEVETPNSVTDSPTIDFSATGILNRTISGSVKISEDVGNYLVLVSDGLFVPTPTSPITYTFSTGLTNTANVITNNLSTGISGGQLVIGGTAASNNLTLSSTTNATKGKILFGTSAYDENQNWFGIGTTTPNCQLNLAGNATQVIRLDSVAGGAGIDLHGATGNTLSFSGPNSFISTTTNDFVIRNQSIMAVIGTYEWLVFGNGHHNQITGTGVGILSDQNFVPLSGIATFANFKIAGNIDQQGGANGTTYGIQISTNLISAPDYRAIQLDTILGYGVYQTSNVPKNYFNGQTGFGNATPDASAKVQIDSITQGFLPPRMTTTQRDAIASPAAGLIIYNITTAKLNVFTTVWEAITSV
jgi:hypothetical protein